MFQPGKISLFAVLALQTQFSAAYAAGQARTDRPGDRAPRRIASRAVRSVKQLPSTARSAVVRPAGISAEKAVVEKAALDIPDLKTWENVGAVTAALQRVPGVHSAVVDLKIHLAVVDYNPARTKIAQFLVACREAGFEAEEYRVESRFPKPIKLKGG